MTAKKPKPAKPAKPAKAKPVKKESKPKPPAKPGEAKKAGASGVIGVLLVLAALGLVVFMLFEYGILGEDKRLLGFWRVTQVEYQGEMVSTRKYANMTGNEVDISFDFRENGNVIAAGYYDGSGLYNSDGVIVNVKVDGATQALALQGETLAFDADGVWMVLQKGAGRSSSSVARTERAERTARPGRTARPSKAKGAGENSAYSELIDLLLELSKNKSDSELQNFGMNYSEDLTALGSSGGSGHAMTREFGGFSWRIIVTEHEMADGYNSLFAELMLDGMSADEMAQEYRTLYRCLGDRYGNTDITAFKDYTAVDSPSLDDAVEVLAAGGAGTSANYGWEFEDAGSMVSLGAGLGFGLESDDGSNIDMFTIMLFRDEETNESIEDTFADVLDLILEISDGKSEAEVRDYGMVDSEYYPRLYTRQGADGDKYQMPLDSGWSIYTKVPSGGKTARADAEFVLKDISNYTKSVLFSEWSKLLSERYGKEIEFSVEYEGGKSPDTVSLPEATDVIALGLNANRVYGSWGDKDPPDLVVAVNIHFLPEKRLLHIIAFRNT